MKITNKPAMLGKSLKGHNVRSRPGDGDEEGDAGEMIAAKEIRLLDIVLTRKQYDFLTGEDCYRRSFDDSQKPAKWLNKFRKIPLPETYTDCEATIQFGVSAKSIELTEAVKIKNGTIKISKADVPTYNCTVQAVFPRKLETLDIEAFYGNEVTVIALKFGDVEEERDDKQGELGLSDANEEQDKQDGAARAKRTPTMDKTRVLAPGQAEREADTERQLSEALRGLEKGDDKKAGKQTPNGSRVN